MDVQWMLLGILTASFTSITNTESVCNQTNPEFVTCQNNFVNIFKGTTTHNESMHAVCSESGKQAVSCYLKYVRQCPELQKGVEKFDFTNVGTEGSLDVKCEMMVGKCQIIQQCISKIPKLQNFEYAGQIMKMKTMANADRYKVLPYFLVLLCGSFKDYLYCFMDSMKNCPNISAILQERMFSGFTNGVAMPTLPQIGTYMKQSCSLEKDFSSKIKCVADALNTTEFSVCFKKVRANLNETSSCEIQQAVSSCVSTWVGSRCGEDAGTFLSTGFRLMYTDIPYECNPSYNTINSENGQSRNGSPSYQKSCVPSLLGAVLIYLLNVLFV